MCFWNINGVSNKFLSSEVSDLFRNKDLLAISETHFKVRAKCPDGFHLVARSKVVKSIKPRGGVALYINQDASIEVREKNIDIPDCLLVEIRNSNVMIVCMYIPPQNSEYYKDDYFDNLQNIIDLFSKSHRLVIVGDLNSRVANMFPTRGYKYKNNPDTIVNTNGQKLLKIVKNYENIILINGLTYNDKDFDSKMTFYRGLKTSQNDTCMSNNIKIIRTFNILPKINYSDHTPCMLNLELDTRVPLVLINDCSAGFKSYHHYDINKKLKKTIKLENMDLVRLDEDLHTISVELHQHLAASNITAETIHEISNTLTDLIYDCCTRNLRKRDDIRDPPQQNCTSENFKAIANANYAQYVRLKDADTITAENYRSEWIYYMDVGIMEEKKERAQLRNKKWAVLNNKNPKELWRLIDWKGDCNAKEENISPETIQTFFRKVFQSGKTANNPTLDCINNVIKNYVNYVDVTDKPISLSEIDLAIAQLGTGVGLDGIDPAIIRIITPACLKKFIHALFNVLFGAYYPNKWVDEKGTQ